MARVFVIPAAIAALSLFGLLAALLGDGAAHVLAWVTLSTPILAAGAGLRGKKDCRDPHARQP